MNRKTARFLPLVSALLTCFTLTTSAVVPPVEKLLPDDTLFVVTIPDFTKMREIYHTSPQTQFWNDPAMRPFKERFLAKLSEELIHPLERELGVQLADYTNLLQGQVTFAMTQNGWPAKDGQHPGVLFLMDTKDKSGQLTKNLSDIRKKWIEAGKTLRTQKIRNIEFAAYPISSKDMPKTLRKFSGPETATDADETTTNEPKSELFIGQNESLLIIGTEAAPIEKVLAHVTGGSVPSLGDLAAYEQNRLSMFRDAPFYGWANAKLLMDGLTHKKAQQDADAQDPFAALNPDRILTAAGVGGVKTLGFSIQMGNEGTTMQIFANVPEESRQGLLKVLQGVAKDSSPPAFVPADAVKFQRWRIDGQKAWATIQKVAADISPQAAGGISFALSTVNELAKQKDPDFDINKNLFGNLGDDLISYQKAPRGNALEDLNSAPSLFLIGSPNAEQFASALKFLFALGNQQAATPDEREFLGRKIYSVPLPGSPIPSANFSATTKPRTLSYAASGGYVALSTDPSMVEEYLRSSDGEHKT
ncbi:MAG TPA: hypothetical protein VKV04_14965, partial [Verrucomicrobiae bacterium]|nr:hypothetical protein [Verrucomicrobiae bacterium]